MLKTLSTGRGSSIEAGLLEEAASFPALVLEPMTEADSFDRLETLPTEEIRAKSESESEAGSSTSWLLESINLFLSPGLQRWLVLQRFTHSTIYIMNIQQSRLLSCNGLTMSCLLLLFVGQLGMSLLTLFLFLPVV